MKTVNVPGGRIGRKIVSVDIKRAWWCRGSQGGREAHALQEKQGRERKFMDSAPERGSLLALNISKRCEKKKKGVLLSSVRHLDPKGRGGVLHASIKGDKTNCFREGERGT